MSDPRIALDGLRVVECGGMISAAYAAKLLADLGAEVIKIEPPGGDPARRYGPFPHGHEDEAHDPWAVGCACLVHGDPPGLSLARAPTRAKRPSSRHLSAFARQAGQANGLARVARGGGPATAPILDTV